METIKRQKIDERINLTQEEKDELSKKSDGKCCHCGRLVFFGYGASVEHFIPISKGGNNRNYNLVMLCKQCNEDKGSFIYRPHDYLTYLKPEHLEKVNGYFESYIKSFDFVNRDNLLACDRYKVMLTPIPAFKTNIKGKVRKNISDTLHKNSIQLWVKKAIPDDIDKLTEYFIKYLKKYDCLDDEHSARINIEFWMTFGCIYYVERDGDIKCFVTVSVTKSNDRVKLDEDTVSNFLTINVFSYYSTEYAYTMAYNLSRDIPRHLTEEQGLKQMPVRYCGLKNDKLSYYLCNCSGIYENGRFISSFMILHSCNRSELPKINEDKDLQKFFKRFVDINRSRCSRWFEMHGEEEIDWMMQELELTKEDDEEESSDDIQE